MSYIPSYFDNDVMAAILILWTVGGAVAVVRGRQRLLPRRGLGRRVTIAAVGAVASIFVYSLYVSERQSVETHDDAVFRQQLRHGAHR